MTLTLRKQREQIFRDAGYEMRDIIPVRNPSKVEVIRVIDQAVLDALDALDTPPVLDREALTAEIAQFSGETGRYEIGFDGGKTHRDQRFAEWLITDWAQGVTVTREQVHKVWCTPDCPTPWRWNHEHTAWMRRNIANVEYVCADSVKFCDSCGTTKPD